MDYSTLFTKELIIIDAEYESQQCMFENASHVLHEKGYVKASFKEAIIQRELDYPTGLKVDKLNCAIPHTDIVHVNKPFIYVTKLKSPLSFIQMGTSDEQVPVESIFMLGITEPSKQVGLLSMIMEQLNNEDFKKSFLAIKSTEEMKHFLKNTFRSDE